MPLIFLYFVCLIYFVSLYPIDIYHSRWHPSFIIRVILINDENDKPEKTPTEISSEKTEMYQDIPQVYFLPFQMKIC